MSLAREQLLKNLEWYELVAMQTGSCVLSRSEIKTLLELIKEKDTIQADTLKKIQDRLTKKASENASVYKLEIITLRNVNQIIKEMLNEI